MQMDEISEEMGLDLQTESLLVRAEQLARLETDKLVDKVTSPFLVSVIGYANVSFVLALPSRKSRAFSQYLYHEYTTLPRIRRERSFHELSSMKEVSLRRQ